MVARENVGIYAGLLTIANNELGFPGCIGARFGHGVPIAPALEFVSMTFFVYWIENKPWDILRFECIGRHNVDLKLLFGEHWHRTTWI